MSATQPLDSTFAPEGHQRLRVVDVGRWLWVVTAVVLVLGFIAVRELSGVDDAPRVEATDGTAVDAAPGAVEIAPKETIHTLVPVTAPEPYSSSLDNQAAAGSFDEYRRVSHDEWPPAGVPMEATTDAPVVK